MKAFRIMLLALLMTTICACALAQQLPGVDVFSPGLMRLSERMQENPAVHMEAELSVSDAFYVRDTSVLREMLEGTQFVYDGAGIGESRLEQLKIVRGGETLFSGALKEGAIAVNEKAFVISREEMAEETLLQELLDFVQKTAILERVPLAVVEAFLLSLEPNEALLCGFAVTQPFTSVQTMSDDGTRLVRINIEGAIAKEGEAPWIIKGYLKQPAGRAPKDTFELTATQDEKNWLELSYSSTRQSEITKKNKAGKANVDTHLKIAGELGGYRISERLTSYLRNTWTADGENLSEKIVVSMTLEHQDNTPGREMQRMNKAETKMRHEIRLATAETENDRFDLTDAITLSVVMDENTVLDIAADTAMSVGAAQAAIDFPDVNESGEEIGGAVGGALEKAAMRLAQSLYAQLSEKTKEKILGGLE